jgi:hypothetical protein
MAESVETMAESTQVGLVQAVEVARQASLREATNGLHYTSFGELTVTADELDRLVNAVPRSIAAAIHDISWFFVPLAMAEGRTAGEGGARGTGHRERPDETMIAPGYTPELAEQAICHRNVELSAEREGIFISTRLLPDRFSLAFEFLINAAHGFVDSAGVPEAFSELAWRQVLADVRGETSNDAWGNRNSALNPPDLPAPTGESGTTASRRIDERAKTAYLEAAFSDAIAIYMLSLAIDIDYSELRERDYPLLAPQPLAERLRHIHTLFPPNPGYEFAIKYRRRA